MNIPGCSTAIFSSVLTSQYPNFNQVVESSKTETNSNWGQFEKDEVELHSLVMILSGPFQITGSSLI